MYRKNKEEFEKIVRKTYSTLENKIEETIQKLSEILESLKEHTSIQIPDSWSEEIDLINSIVSSQAEQLYLEKLGKIFNIATLEIDDFNNSEKYNKNLKEIEKFNTIIILIKNKSKDL
ncbi:MAG: hypothetical protein NZ889_00505 [Candidatus Pacearchaeota archaeon]|nr:hypothetical protein [Candidatus Pacearchaeota archaeon]